MSWQPGIYFAPSGCYWIRVHQLGAAIFRADTNYHMSDPEWYEKHIAHLTYRATREDAQADLDALASSLSLVAVPQPTVMGRAP